MLFCMAWLISTSTSMIFLKRLALCLAFIFLVLLQNSVLADLNGDAAALLAFKGNTTNAGNLLSWNASNTSSVCTWEGVTCGNTTSSSSSSSSSLRVTQIRLPGSSLSGSIPAQTLGNLDALQVLSLRKNKLSGTLPSDLANCVSLQEVNLKNNSFNGSLVFDFSAWPLLQRLDLSSNNFSGQIPASIVNLTHLNTLLLEENVFSGTIPPIAIPSLQSFNVTSNRLDGSIPLSLSNFSADSFAGNLDLCGSPLPECPQMQSPAGAPQSTPAAGSNGEGNNNSDKLHTGAIVGIVLGALAFAIIVFSVCFLLIVRKNAKQGPDDFYAGGQDVDLEAQKKGRSMSRKASRKSGANGGALVLNNRLIFMGNAKQTFDLDGLLRASAEVLGKGTLGTSYKADIDEGHPLCVKRFREVATDREHTCKHIEMLGALKHPNLVPLRAYFFAPKGKLLVSDYMPKGSLSSLLHGNKREATDPLDWETRLAIAEGAAKGLVFLHSQKVVHGNIKSSNVVMDAEGQARLTDYSLMQLIPLSTEPGVTLKPNAFTPPESRDDLRNVVYKGDVYAFGVLLLELVTGKAPNSGSLTKNGNNIDRLVHWVQAHCPQDMESVLDARLPDSANSHVQDEMISLMQIAMPCVSVVPGKRPHMVEVVSSISNLRKRDVRPESTDFYFTQAV